MHLPTLAKSATLQPELRDRELQQVPAADELQVERRVHWEESRDSSRVTSVVGSQTILLPGTIFRS